MLEMIRKGANSWAAKILLGLVALSFVYWGAERRSGPSGASSLATVGGTAITQTEFQRAYDTEINNLSQRAQRRVTAEEARAYGIDRRVLSRLVGQAAIDNQAKQLGLALSDETIAESLKRDPNFKGFDGKFDRAGFDNLLRNLGLSERGFIALKRQDDVRDQLTSAILAATVTPKPIVDAVYNWTEETRVIEHMTLDAGKVTVAEPDAVKLKETYEGNKSQFMAPETRKLQILLLSVDELKKDVPVSDADIAASYEQSKDLYTTPELRRVQQIPFKTKEAAAAAKAAIDGGKNFMAVAEENGLKESDVEIGLVNKKGIIDPRIATAAFALERDKVSDVVEGRLTTVLLRVPEIKGGKLSTLDEVKDRVRDKLARAKAKDDLQKLRDSADDMRNAAKSDKEIADALKLKLVEVASTTSANKDPDGKTAFEHPDAKALIAAGFDSKSGGDREPVDLADGGYGWVTTLAPTPARQRPFEEVEAGVKSLYMTLERRRLVQELASKLIERLNKGEAFDAIATELSGKVEKTLAMTRTTLPQGLTDAAVKQAFALPQGRAGAAETADRKSRTVFVVTEVKAPAPPAKDQTGRLAQEIGQQIQIDTIDAYVTALQDAAGVKINDNEFRRLTGSGSAQ